MVEARKDGQIQPLVGLLVPRRIAGGAGARRPRPLPLCSCHTKARMSKGPLLAFGQRWDVGRPRGAGGET